MVWFDPIQIRVPHGDEVVVVDLCVGGALIDKATMKREGDGFLIDTKTEGVSFSAIQNGKPVGEEFLFHRMALLCRSIDHSRQWQKERAV